MPHPDDVPLVMVCRRPRRLLLLLLHSVIAWEARSDSDAIVDNLEVKAGGRTEASYIRDGSSESFSDVSAHELLVEGARMVGYWMRTRVAVGRWTTA